MLEKAKDLKLDEPEVLKLPWTKLKASIRSRQFSRTSWYPKRPQKQGQAQQQGQAQDPQGSHVLKELHQTMPRTTAKSDAVPRMDVNMTTKGEAIPRMTVHDVCQEDKPCKLATVYVHWMHICGLGR